MSKAITAYEIHVNGSLMHFDVDAWKRGKARVVRGMSSEQCEDCGQDMAETAQISRGGLSIMCGESSSGCGRTYPVELVTLR